MLGKVLWSLVLLVTLAFSLILIADQADLQQVRGISARDGDIIVVQFADGSRDEVRYASINAPGFKNHDCFSDQAKECNERLVKERDLWLELNPTDEGYEQVQDRLLAHVFLSPERSQTSSVEVQLVAKGCARLDVINPSDTAIRNGQDFEVRYADWIIAVQIEAAKAHLGWWGAGCDDYEDSDVIIVAIKQWSDDEIVYIVNRGDEPIDLAAGWKLWDEAGKEGSERNRLDFSDKLGGQCLLPPGGLLRVHSGSVATGRGGEHTTCGEPVVDFYWTGHPIWDQDKDKAWLYRPDGSIAYYYYYPLDWD